MVVVACSGGPDSLALVAATAWVAQQRGWRAGAVVVDHGLQEQSAQVAAQAARTCELLGVSAQVRAVLVGSHGGPEAAARTARYAALTAVAEDCQADAVLLGHTRDDQAETVLLRLARGSGARSLAAMAPIDGLWRRPLLGLSREDVHAAATQALQQTGQHAWMDPHNADERFARVRVRRILAELTAALGPGVVDGLVRSADALRDDADALDDRARQAFANLLSQDSSGTLDAGVMGDWPRALRTRVLRAWLLAAGSPAEDLDRAHVLAVDALIVDWHGQGPIAVPGGLAVQRSCGRLRINGRQ